MPRRREVPKREILPDPKFGNQDVSKFINTIMQSGKSLSPSASSMVLFLRLKPRVARIPWKCLLLPLATRAPWLR